MTKEYFVEAFTEFIEDEFFDEIEVGVKMPSLPEIELISNPRANFEAKLEYYKNAYDDDMCLKSFPDIKIVSIVAY